MKIKSTLRTTAACLVLSLVAVFSYQAHLLSLERQRQAHLLNLERQNLSYQKYILSLQAASISWIQSKTPEEAIREIQDYGFLRLRRIKEGTPYDIGELVFPSDFISKMEAVFKNPKNE